jgi:hypothetical protein
MLGGLGLPGVAFSVVHTVNSMAITSGNFFMSDGVTPGRIMFSFIGPNTNLVGGYINGGVDSPDPDPNAIARFEFFGAPVNLFTGATSNIGGIPGGPVPTGTVDDSTGVLSMNLTSYFANWNGTDFNQGSATASTDFIPSAGTPVPADEAGSVTCAGTSCTFTNLEWQSLIVGGPFNGKTGTWTLSGSLTISPGFSSAGGIIPTPASGLLTNEAGGTDSFTIVLTSAPGSDVTIPFASSDLTEGTVSPASLTFTPANFSVPQSVTVTGVDDGDQDLNTGYSVDIGPTTSGDPTWNNRTFNSIGAVNEDNDFASTQTISTEVSDGFFGCTLSDSRVRPWQRADLALLGIGMLVLAARRRRLVSKMTSSKVSG